MSSTTGTRIFGIRVTVDPKILIGALVLLAALLFWYNSRSDDEPARTAAPPSIASPAAVTVAPSGRPTVAQRRAGAPANERNTLRLRPYDGSHGDIDPTLRLDLLKQVGSVPLTPSSRNLFEAGSAPQAALTAKLPPIKAPIILPKGPGLNASPLGPAPGALNLQVNIPFKYYGYVKPSTPSTANRGLFLDGDNVMVASEGELLKQKYLVVELTPNSARLEDTSLKQGQTLPVVPVALP